MSLPIVRSQPAAPVPTHADPEPATSALDDAPPIERQAPADISATAPISVRDAVAAGQLPRQTDPTERAAIRDALSGAQLVQGSERVLDLGGTSGTPSRITLQRTDGSTFDAFTKPAAPGDARELLGQDVAEKFGIGYLTIPTVLRNGQLTAPFNAGVQAGRVGVRDVNSLQDSLRGWYDQHTPEMAPADRAGFARLETELAQTMDYVIAMPDRHSRNVMIDPDQHQTHLIDFNSIGIEVGVKDPLRPFLTGTYQPKQGLDAIHAQLSDDTLAFLRKRITPDDLRAIAAPYATGSAPVLTPAQTEHMAQRLEHVLTTGSFDAQRSPLRDFTFERVGNVADRSPFLRKIVQQLIPHD